MPQYQVWAKDRYNRHEILSILNKVGRPESLWSSPEEAQLAARRYANEKNRGGPMTYEEQQRSIGVLVFEPNNAIYAGALIHGQQKALYKTASGPDGDRWEELALPADAVGQFYVGQAPKGGDWYYTDPRKRLVTSIKHELLEDKTLLFVHEQK